jgi:histone H3/H4
MKKLTDHAIERICKEHKVDIRETMITTFPVRISEIAQACYREGYFAAMENVTRHIDKVAK